MIDLDVSKINDFPDLAKSSNVYIQHSVTALMKTESAEDPLYPLLYFCLCYACTHLPNTPWGTSVQEIQNKAELLMVQEPKAEYALILQLINALSLLEKV